jgi:AraC family transcriptional regulator of adaptative response/methylated-DNA-[protein]-cysteine methyltransferase
MFQVELVRCVCRYIEANVQKTVTLAALSAHVGVSPCHLQRTFKRVMGITPRQYAEARRLNHVKEHLKNGYDVTRSLYAAGYGSSSRLYEKAQGQLGMTPGIYRRGGQGMQIFYSVMNCPLGWLLVATTERGLCAVNFGNSDTELEAALRREYPAAQVQKDEARLRAWTKALQEYFKGREFDPHLPVDVQATAFQWRVWQELRKIPYGETRSYSEVARAIGRPKAVRAVANACARNPVGLVIPCHRVIREDGSLGGYGGGIKRKHALLTHEGVVKKTPNE